MTTHLLKFYIPAWLKSNFCILSCTRISYYTITLIKLFCTYQSYALNNWSLRYSSMHRYRKLGRPLAIAIIQLSDILYNHRINQQSIKHIWNYLPQHHFAGTTVINTSKINCHVILSNVSDVMYSGHKG